MTPESEALGQRLRAAREAAHLTQAVVAGRLGISRQRVVAHEAGQGELPARRLSQYARLYGVAEERLRYSDLPADAVSVNEAVLSLDAAWRKLRAALEREGVLPARPAMPED